MRRWLTLFVVLGTAFLAVLSGSEFFGEHVAAYEAADLYAPGGDPDAKLEQQFDVTPGTFSGTFAPPATCGTNALSIGTGTQSIDVAVTATLATNDITVALLDPSGTQVGFSDTLTSPEVVHYASGSIAAGTWTVKVCPAANGAAFLPPYDYTGVVTTSTVATPGLPGLPAGGVNAADAGTVTPSFVAGDLRFSPETIVDPQRTEGEPVNFFAPDGSYWESGPFGTSTQQSWVHRSTDGGLEFHETSPVGLRPDAPPGGGDTDVVVDDQGNAYFSDLEGLTNVSTSVSNDGGNTWRKNALAAQEVGVDRQWYAMDDGATPSPDDNTVFFSYRQIPGGPQILSSPGSKGASDPVGGLVWTNAASTAGQVSVSSGAPCGKMLFDPVKRNLYMPCGQGDHIEVVVGHVDPGQRTNIDFHTVELQPAPPKGDPSMVFPWLGVDQGGNVMVVWIDGTDHNVYESVSTDGTKSFTTPVKINTGDAVTNEFPEVAGGAAGTFVITWYGTSIAGSSDDMPANDSADSGKYPWYGYAAVVSKADTLTPTVAQQRFTKHPMHYGIVCNAGTTCVSGRTLADYFDVGIDQKGAIRIVFDDESSQYRQAHLMEVRQLLSGPEPKSPMDDPANDARMPHYSPTGPGANLPQADFTNLALSQPRKGVLRVQMTLANLASLAPPPTKPTLVWLTRFQAKSVLPNGAEAYRIFYVGARSTAGGAPVFFSGSGDNPTGCLSASSGCKIMFYPAENTLTSGSRSGNTITIDVSLEQGFGSGRPIDGSTLYSVTALSYGQNGDADVYLEGDATHSFDYSLGGAPSSVAQPTAKPSGGSSGGGVSGANAHPIDNGVQSSGSAVGPARHGAAGKGKVQRASFRLNVSATQVLFTWTQRGVRVRVVKLTTARFGAHAATLRGLALVNGRRVRFAAVAVDHGRRGDVLKLAWNGGPSRGGVLRAGGLTVT
jgi:hypothetical protein